MTPTKDCFYQTSALCIALPTIYLIPTPLYSMLRRLLQMCGILPDCAGIAEATSSQRPISPEPPVRELPELRRQLTNLADDSHSQEQSLLITRLPVDVRLIIWEFAMGREFEDDILHLQPVEGILRHCRCFVADRTDLSITHICWRTLWRREDLDSGIRNTREPLDCRKIRSLLLTCRLIYHESVNVMYQSNTFDMRQVESVIRLPKVILPQRLQHVRRIRFTTAFKIPVRLDMPRKTRQLLPDDHAQWPAACQVFATIATLESLEVIVALWSPIPSQRQPADVESLLAVLTPLKLARASNYTVALTEPVPAEVRAQLGVLPYKLTQRVRPGIGFYSRKSDH
ncbi:unnamed protein product [Zymoseptoria tritici ST99CH_1E4]|uniref:DUF7730 domain-containing protein n=1 Tax=Zymoseptoria tritici ST99CH_1E4 TaxID=1276532 RepID=A0A2H1FWH8_ZYMTR|nr:unnamed protein product [Zymoseptoria tritici ST99CH_1E4]